MYENVFIIGATGTIGSAVVESLKQSNYELTALIHSNTNTFLENNAKLIKGSLTDTTLLKNKLVNHDYLFIAVNAGNDPETIYSIEEEAIIDVLKIAEDVGIKKVVYISGMYAEDRFSNHPSEGSKVNVEKHLKASTLPYTIFKPGFIDVTLQQFVQDKQIMLLGKQPYPMHIVKLREMANDIADSFSMPETNNQTYIVTGRETPMLLKDALEQYAKKFDPVLPVKVMPLWFMKILNKTFLKCKLTRAIDTMSLMQKYGEVGDLEKYHNRFSSTK
ncbi:NAD(P)H-binding protein (plasmid) [Mammaliicoccus sciuri]|uniref:NAD(P)H-binding protein n=1 Tax=Mammaliicoccus sciuri TaxID=1296 RepID=UPI00194FB1AF